MYNQNNPPNQTPPYNYYAQQHSVSPPPLQHPIPTHPPIQMRDPPVSSPSPPTQQRMTHQHQQIPHPQHPHQQQHIQQGPTDYNGPWFNDATTQMGMQFGRTAMAAGSEYVEKNVKFASLNIILGCNKYK